MTQIPCRSLRSSCVCRRQCQCVRACVRVRVVCRRERPSGRHGPCPRASPGAHMCAHLCARPCHFPCQCPICMRTWRTSVRTCLLKWGASHVSPRVCVWQRSAGFDSIENVTSPELLEQLSSGERGAQVPRVVPMTATACRERWWEKTRASDH